MRVGLVLCSPPRSSALLCAHRVATAASYGVNLGADRGRAIVSDPPLPGPLGASRNPCAPTLPSHERAWHASMRLSPRGPRGALNGPWPTLLSPGNVQSPKETVARVERVKWVSNRVRIK